MADLDDLNATRPLVSANVLYRCTCGTDLQLVPELGGTCHRCGREITPKILAHEMSISTITDGSFEIFNPLPVANGVASKGSLPTRLDSQLTQTLQGDVTRKESGPPIFEQPESLLGKSYGHFELKSPLGRGGMAQVYRALDTSLQRYVAVKVLRRDTLKGGDATTRQASQAADDLQVDKLLQEAVTQARLTHPNIVTIYFVGKQEGNPFLAMELVSGEPLNDRIAKGEMPFAEITSIANQITDALKHSYELGLIHGDIKPSNILLEKDGTAKLSDFGMARSIETETEGTIGGTPNYIAPELLQGQKPSMQSDVYALGVTLYEMSFGKMPVDLTGKAIGDWSEIHKSSNLEFPHPWPDRYPEVWKKMLAKMLAPNPEDRYQDYESLQADLSDVTPHSQVLARQFPRIVAAGIDWISVLLLAGILQVVFELYQWGGTIANFLRFSDLIPIIVYAVGIYIWRQSLGRSLMHIRVVNQYGLHPKPLRMLLRCFFRMQFPICGVGILLFADASIPWVETFISVLLLCCAFFLLIDAGFMAFDSRRRALHDLIMKTEVVVDIGTGS